MLNETSTRKMPPACAVIANRAFRRTVRFTGKSRDQIIPVGELIQHTRECHSPLSHVQNTTERSGTQGCASGTRKTTSKNGHERKPWLGQPGQRHGRLRDRMRTTLVYIPLQNMWVKFRFSSGTNGTPGPALARVWMKLQSADQFEASLQQARKRHASNASWH